MAGDISGGAVRWNLDIDDGQFNAKLDRASSDVRSTATRIDSTLGSISRSITNGFGRIATSVGSIAFDSLEIGTTAVTSAISALGIKGITSASQLQSLQISLNGLTK